MPSNLLEDGAVCLRGSKHYELQRVVDQILGPAILWPLHEVFLPVEMEMRTEVEIVV